MAKRFERALEAATDQTLVESNWDGIMECVDMIRGSDVPVKDAINLIQKRYRSPNPHVAHHTLLVLEACVKNCGKKFHTEIATKEFMDDLKQLVIAGAPDTVKEKVLELIQCWASAFRKSPEYKIVLDTHNLLKMNGFEFPALIEADAMFMAHSAPEWADGDNCYRCRVEFGMFTRKHHCRACGQIFCLKCSNKQMLLPQFGIEKMVRVCELCYEKSSEQKTTSTSGPIQSDKEKARKEAEENARLQELQEKEELELALAISQSEAEAKEKERQSGLYRSYNGHSTTNNGYGHHSAVSELPSQPEIYKGAGGSSILEEALPTKMENDSEPPLDPMLAKYLDRDYWERKRTDKDLSATAPPPSEGGGSSGASQFAVPNAAGPDTEEDNVAETSQFCKALKEQVDIMNNRMQSNLMRGRSIVNDSAIHSLFAQLTSHHANVLSRLNKLESDREYNESLQDHLAHIQEARQAVNALRDEFETQRQEQLKDEQYRRRIQMQQKLDFMRQKKHEMLLYQRHMALQRFQEQEQQMQQNRYASPHLHQQQQYGAGPMGGVPAYASTPQPMYNQSSVPTHAYQSSPAVSQYQTSPQVQGQHQQSGGAPAQDPAFHAQPPQGVQSGQYPHSQPSAQSQLQQGPVSEHFAPIHPQPPQQNSYPQQPMAHQSVVQQLPPPAYSASGPAPPQQPQAFHAAPQQYPAQAPAQFPPQQFQHQAFPMQSGPVPYHSGYQHPGYAGQQWDQAQYGAQPPQGYHVQSVAGQPPHPGYQPQQGAQPPQAQQQPEVAEDLLISFD
ncbi:VHS domain-containing protein [Ditylenchus destructor]|uniref:Hepatocyte growth factor-regulated tyrosine kinase substrate n=1 Tax=Ditylenchus destructor TaxID=166010 RepID=A0AAD4N9D2_9BILA|nr:VHS domain-containing protein [Ditylenchus destructor]